MKFIVFSILILTIVIMYFYYENKLSLARKRLRITSNQFNTIKKEYNNSFSKNKNINVKFLTPTIKTAILNNKTDVFLAPLSDSPKIKTLDIRMEVKILDSAIINNTIWFYVTLPVDSEYNCRGWVNNLSVIYNDSNDFYINYK